MKSESYSDNHNTKGIWITSAPPYSGSSLTSATYGDLICWDGRLRILPWHRAPSETSGSSAPSSEPLIFPESTTFNFLGCLFALVWVSGEVFDPGFLVLLATLDVHESSAVNFLGCLFALVLDSRGREGFDPRLLLILGALVSQDSTPSVVVEAPSFAALFIACLIFCTPDCVSTSYKSPWLKDAWIELQCFVSRSSAFAAFPF